MGDAAATAHFSIGSGTKLAVESAIALATYIEEEESLAKRDACHFDKLVSSLFPMRKFTKKI